MMRLIYCICIILFSSCGKHKFPNYEIDTELPQFEERDATYTTILKSINGRPFTGDSLLWLKGNQFYVKVTVKNNSPLTRFYQFIHTNGHCPNLKDDDNKDGILDFDESLRVAGEIVVPLDRDLEGQVIGSEWYPVSNKNGDYFYSRATSLAKFLTDLHASDNNRSDDFGKLSPAEDFSADKRVIIIYKDVNGYLLPTACGKYHES